MPCPITITKFVGTISLGLLTGVSYTLSSLAYPSLTTLPTASRASQTLTTLRARSTSTILSLSTLSSISLLTAYLVSPKRSKHPYLIWTALVAIIGGPGVEWWVRGRSGISSYLSLERLGLGGWRRGAKAKGKDVEGEEDEDMVVVNGESVEREVLRERRINGVRTGVLGLGFAMGVVGVWGDGA